MQKEGKAGRLTYFCGQIGTVSLQKEGKARRLTYFCGRSPSGRKTDAKQILRAWLLSCCPIRDKTNRHRSASHYLRAPWVNPGLAPPVTSGRRTIPNSPYLRPIQPWAKSSSPSGAINHPKSSLPWPHSRHVPILLVLVLVVLRPRPFSGPCALTCLALSIMETDRESKSAIIYSLRLLRSYFQKGT